jgi:hypothetical protein
VETAPKAAGFDLNGNTIEKTGNKVTVYGIQRSEITVESSASKSTFKKVGDMIDYNIRVKNLGNISIFNVNITDPTVLISTVNAETEILPGASAVYAASHVVTQADMDAGQVVSAAQATGFDLNSKKVEGSGNKVTVKGLQTQELTTIAESSVATYKNEGDAIGYTVKVRNTGNVTMNNIFVTDDRSQVEFTQSITSLAPGETALVTTEYRVSLNDINEGKVITVPVANGYDPNSRKFSYQANDVTVKLAIENLNLTNFPNPFTNETKVVFDLPEAGLVYLRVFDMTGREVGQLDLKECPQGRNYVTWKANSAGKGLYVLKVYFNGVQATRVISIVN